MKAEHLSSDRHGACGSGIGRRQFLLDRTALLQTTYGFGEAEPLYRRGRFND